MTAPRSVEVVIGGHRLVVSSDHSPEYTTSVAAHFDEALQRIRSAMPTIDAQRAAILAGLAVTDELFEARRRFDERGARVGKVTEQLARLVAPDRRGAEG